jgi:hypothetical protein
MLCSNPKTGLVLPDNYDPIVYLKDFESYGRQQQYVETNMIKSI